MVTSVAVTETIKTWNDLEERFNLCQTDSDRFFSEWIDDLPELSEAEQVGVNRIKRRYDYHRSDRLLLEGTVNFIRTCRFSRPTISDSLSSKYYPRTGRFSRDNSWFD
ncbi:hypothetical protein [Oscillatoria salina]|uniref:hypothetical protein n=1 Tax=Oscillatoria salina TaxID=331517 RepID=UPI001CCF4A3D|nr:hypothetical protein [Oscillatoria salina]